MLTVCTAKSTRVEVKRRPPVNLTYPLLRSTIEINQKGKDQIKNCTAGHLSIPFSDKNSKKLVLLKMPKSNNCVHKFIEIRNKFVPATIEFDENNADSFKVQTIDRNVKVRTMCETVTLTKSRTDFTGSSPKRYTTKCYIKPTTLPYWYTESVLLKIGSTKKVYTETVHFKSKFVPIKWSENMSTEVKTGPKCIMSEDYIPLEDESEFHYISLIPQQEAARAPTTSL